MALTKVTYSMIDGAVFNVRDYGAVGDGVADDTTKIQAAITAAGAVGGGTVYLPAGTYKLTASLSVTQNKTYIKGSGTGNTILSRATDYGNTITFTGNNTTGTLLTDVGISDLAFYSTALTTSGAHIYANGVWRMTVNDIFMLHGFIGFELRGVLASTFNNIYVVFTSLFSGSTTNRRYMYFGNAVGSYSHPSCGDVFVNNFNLRGNTSNQITEYGIQIVSADGLWFENGHVGNTTDANIYIIGATSELLNLVFFTNVMSDEGTEYGLQIAGSTPVTFTKIQFANCMFKSGGTPAFAKYGIYISSGCTVKNVQFSNCQVTEFGRSGVTIESVVCEQIDFDSCQVYFNGRETPNTYPGYNLLASSKEIRITGGLSGNSTTQAYGIQLGGSHSNILVTSVDLTGNSLGSVNGYNGSVTFANCRISGSAVVASAATITPVTGYNYILVSGTTTIDNVSTAQVGSIITLQFSDVLTVKHATGNLQLAGDFTTSPNDTLTLMYNGAVWTELSRSVNL